MFGSVIDRWNKEAKIESVLRKSSYYMSMVYLTAMQSEDPDTKIGCVIVGPDKEIRSTGYNGLPRGIKITKERLERPEKYKWMEHAERNAFYNATRMGISIKDCFLYVNGMPCHDCARAIIQSGISHVIVHKKFHELSKERWYPGIQYTEEMFKEANVKINSLDENYPISNNLVGYLDGKLINLK